MSSIHRGPTSKIILVTAVVALFAPVGVLAQASNTQAKAAASISSERGERWLHVRVIPTDSRGDTVRVNVPLELAEKVLPAVNHDRLHNGKVRIDNQEINDIDLRAIMEAVRSSKDGEFVTAQGNDNDVRVAKEANHMIIHVVDKGRSKKSQVEVKVPMKVMEALLSAGKDELDLVAALHALETQGDVELVSVKDSENTVRVWMDSKNAAD